MKVGYSGYVHRGAQRTRAEPHAAALHVQRQRPGQRRVPGRRQRACARRRCRTSCRRAGISTIARRRIGLYAQDQWTVGRLTLQGGVRYDRAWSWAPAEGNGTTETSRFNPQPISFERTVSVRGYNDITPRFGVAYDLFGNGKTALKVNGGKYLEAATVRRHLQLEQSGGAHHHAHRVGAGGGARLDRRQPQLRRRLRPAESGGAGQPGHRRRPVCGGRRRRPELRQRQPEHHDHQSGRSSAAGACVRTTGSSAPRCSTSSCRGCRSRPATTAAGGGTSSSPTTC